MAFITITNHPASLSRYLSIKNAKINPNPQNRFMLILYINVIESLTVSSPNHQVS